ncbi:hypothetical protein HOLleu_44188 [Holothuria leucospilota]|uniref:Uncharacterized protein n=1 Tax=Holothuria leucospilota TaxID=206669 RepID=A0A9Q0YAW5_HOLLE|nr:hypothetical protein HOLleu_44188 [Holothuria leucospilota]
MRLFDDLEIIFTFLSALKKKILALGKRKQCEAVNDWRKSVINHLYWSASSTPDGSEACESLCKVLTNTRLRNDVKKMSPKQQTSRLEAFHSLVNFFAPKLTVFSYEGMTCRMLLAAMHYNENSNRDAATTQSGEKLYSIDFPRAKGGDYTLREVQSPATFGYVNDLMEEATLAVQNSVNIRQQISGLQNIPEPVSASYPRPSLQEAVRRQSTRYAPSAASRCDAAGPSSS